MSVAFLTRDFSNLVPLVPGGCAYYRCYLPAAVTKENALLGLPTFDPIKGFGIKESDKIGMFGFKTIVLKLLMDAPLPTQIRLAQNNVKQRIIVDIDDYYEGLTPANKAYHLSHPDNNKRTNRDHYAKVIEAADLVTVSTPFLLEHYKKIHPNVVMIRNGVNMQQFTPVIQNTRPVFGWTGSVNYRNNDLEQLRAWLPDFLEEHDLKFHHLGASQEGPSFSEITGVDPRRVTTTPLSAITNYANGFRFDIGLVPLNNIPFNEAKSNIKGLEYSAAGIPFIASDLPEYRTLHMAGAGTLANTPEEWREAATRLLDRKQRITQARQATAVIRENWSIEARAKEWDDVLGD